MTDGVSYSAFPTPWIGSVPISKTSALPLKTSKKALLTEQTFRGS